MLNQQRLVLLYLCFRSISEYFSFYLNIDFALNVGVEDEMPLKFAGS